MLTLTNRIDMRPGAVPLVIHLGQYDSDFSLVFELYSSAGNFTVESGTTAMIRGTKTDGNAYDADATIDISAKTVTVAGSEQMTAAKGRNVYELVLTKSGKVLSTANFILDVERAAMDADTIASESVLKELNAIIAGAETVTEAAADAATAADRAEDAAESVSSASAQIATNTADIADLKADLSDDVSDLKSALSYKADNVYGGAYTPIAQALTAGKTWHATYGNLVNSANRAASWAIEVTPDMKSLSVSSGYAFTVYGNDLGVNNPLTTLSNWLTADFSIENNVTYKYLYVIIARTDQATITQEEVADVLKIKTYDAPLPFALVNDLTGITNNVSDGHASIKDIEEDVGVKHIILSAHKLGNFAISANGEITGAISTRVATIDKIPIWANAPTYISVPSGYFRPLLYLFKNGTFTSMVNNHVNGNTYDADEIRMLFFKNPNTQDITPQEVAAGFTMWQVKTDSLPNRISALENADVEHNDYSLIAYGDSLTTGAGASSSTKTYWAVCASQLSMKNRIGFGFGGSQSKAIAFTAGALSAYIPPNANTFKIKYADLESNLTIAANALNGKTVIVNGAEYTISQTSPTDFSLPNTYSPSNIYLPVVNKNSRYTADVYVIWMGTNDSGMQWDLIDAMIAKLPHKKYIVMGLTRLGTDTTVEDEEKAYRLYGSHYFNTRKQIINNAFALLGATPTAEDETAMSNGLMPPSLLVDSTHFNDSGYEVIGKLLAMHIKSLGYTFQIA